MGSSVLFATLALVYLFEKSRSFGIIRAELKRFVEIRPGTY